MGDAVVETGIFVEHRLGQAFRGDAGTRVCRGGFPMVASGTAGTASAHITLFNQYDLPTLTRSGNGRHAAGNAAAGNKDIRRQVLPLRIFQWIRPFRSHVFIPSL
jgi:hypothetical protein